MDNINHPKHYNQHPVAESIEIAEHFNFNLGNVIKYIFRAEYKGQRLEDLCKAEFYIKREIKRIEKYETNS